MNRKSRSENSIRSFVWMVYTAGVISVFPFVIRTLLIRYIGIEYTGVSNLFAAVLQVLNIADLGIEPAASFFYTNL